MALPFHPTYQLMPSITPNKRVLSKKAKKKKVAEAKIEPPPRNPQLLRAAFKRGPSPRCVYTNLWIIGSMDYFSFKYYIYNGLEFGICGLFTGSPARDRHLCGIGTRPTTSGSKRVRNSSIFHPTTKNRGEICALLSSSILLLPQDKTSGSNFIGNCLEVS